MTEDIDEVELFEYQGYVCSVRTMQSKFNSDAAPWYQGNVYIKDGVSDRSNWYTKREDAVRMAELMVRKVIKGGYR